MQRQRVSLSWISIKICILCLARRPAHVFLSPRYHSASEFISFLNQAGAKPTPRARTFGAPTTVPPPSPTSLACLYPPPPLSPCVFMYFAPVHVHYLSTKERIIRPATPASEYGAFALVVVIRFLERSAFDTLARLVDPRGGYILLSTFIEEERETAVVPGSGGGREGRGVSARKEKKENSTWRGSLKAASAATAAAIAAAAAAAASAVATAATTAGVGSGTGRGNRETGLEERDDRSCGQENEATVTADGTRDHHEKAWRAAAATAAAEGQGDIAGAPVATETKNRKKTKPGSAAAALAAAAAAATLARWPHASPRDAKKILRRGELARYFGDRHGFEVLEDSVVRLPDGRPVCCFLGRRVRASRGGARGGEVKREEWGAPCFIWLCSL